MTPVLSCARNNSAQPVLQPSVLREACSFICRRCYTAPVESHHAFDAPYHFHPEFEITYIESSHGIRYVADSSEPYAPGDLVLIGGNVPHVFARDLRTEASEHHSSIVTQFRLDFMGDGFFDRPELRNVRNLLASSAQGLHFDAKTADKVRLLLVELLQAESATRLVLLLRILECLAHAKGRPLASGGITKPIDRKDLERIQVVCKFIEENYENEIGLETIAQVAALGPASFSRWFKTATSKSFVEYLTEVRLSHAYKMLVETNKNITEVAFDCGFTSISHFIHRFTKIRGVSPRQFRQKMRENLPVVE